MLKELMGLWSSGLPLALRSEATTVRGMSPRKQVTSVQRLGRGFGHASCNVAELIPSAPTRTSPGNRAAARAAKYHLRTSRRARAGLDRERSRPGPAAGGCSRLPGVGPPRAAGPLTG